MSRSLEGETLFPNKYDSSMYDRGRICNSDANNDIFGSTFLFFVQRKKENDRHN